jgi:hypothetical protein
LSIVRIYAAVLVAAATPALLLAVMMVFDNGSDRDVIFLMIATFIIALLHAFILGLPTYFVLQRFGLTFWWMSMICGFVIALVPFAIFSWPDAHVISGVPNYARLIQYIKNSGFLGALGMCGGLAGWLTWRFLPALIGYRDESSESQI